MGRDDDVLEGGASTTGAGEAVEAERETGSASCTVALLSSSMRASSANELSPVSLANGENGRRW